MYKELPSLNRCCFCASLRRGLLVWAYVKLVFNLLVFGCGLIWLTMVGLLSMFELSEGQIYGFILSTAVLILCLSDLIFTFVLLLGAHKRDSTLLRLFYRFAAVHCILFVIFGALTIALVTSSYIGIDKDEIGYVIAVFSLIYFTFLIIYIYQLLLVHSAIVDVTPNGQVQFLNHNADPKCVMQVDYQSEDKSKEILMENPGC